MFGCCLISWVAHSVKWRCATLDVSFKESVFPRDRVYPPPPPHVSIVQSVKGQDFSEKSHLWSAAGRLHDPFSWWPDLFPHLLRLAFLHQRSYKVANTCNFLHRFRVKPSLHDLPWSLSEYQTYGCHCGQSFSFKQMWVLWICCALCNWKKRKKKRNNFQTKHLSASAQFSH